MLVKGATGSRRMYDSDHYILQTVLDVEDCELDIKQPMNTQ